MNQLKLATFFLALGVVALCLSSCLALAQHCNNVVVSEKEVMDFIFKNYSKFARPRRNASMPVEVSLALHIRGIHDLVERENTLILDGYIEANWTDEYLAWNEKFPYSCLKKIVAPPGSIWLPDIAIVNAPNGIFSLMLGPGFGIEVFSNGSAFYSPGGQIQSQCEFDVAHFPFDVQICQVNFESWNQDISAQVFKLDQKPFLKVEGSWTENRQWSIEGNFSAVSTFRYHNPADYAHASFVLVIQRKALFYYINIIVPSVIISVVELATFALPIYEVTKIHISFTCLLAYSVFQGMVIADLPRSGDSVPLLSLYIDLQMAYIGLIALMGEAIVFQVIRKAKMKKETPPPRVAVAFVVLARVLRISYNRQWTKYTDAEKFLSDKAESCADLSVLSAHDSGITLPLTIQYFDTTNGNTSSAVRKKAVKSNRFKAAAVDSSVANLKKSPGLIRRQWMLIAEVVERLNIIVYCAAITLTPLVMFTMVPRNDTENALATLSGSLTRSSAN